VLTIFYYPLILGLDTSLVFLHLLIAKVLLYRKIYLLASLDLIYTRDFGLDSYN